MKQVNGEWDNARIMELKELEEKLKKLRSQLHELEVVEAERIREKRIAADFGDDYRENEGAKLVASDQHVWYVRKLQLKSEIVKLRKQIVSLKYNL